MPNIAEPVAATVSQVNVKFQSSPMQDVPSFAGKVTMPGVGPETAKKLLKCNIKNPCALLGQFMVHFQRPVVAAVCGALCLRVAFHGLPFVIHDDRVVFVYSFVLFRRPASSFGVFGRHAALLRLNMHTWRRVHAVVLLQVLDCDKAQMNMWLCAVARIRPHEATMIIAALDEKCGKILAV